MLTDWSPLSIIHQGMTGRGTQPTARPPEQANTHPQPSASPLRCAGLPPSGLPFRPEHAHAHGALRKAAPAPGGGPAQLSLVHSLTWARYSWPGFPLTGAEAAGVHDASEAWTTDASLVALAQLPGVYARRPYVRWLEYDPQLGGGARPAAWDVSATLGGVSGVAADGDSWAWRARTLLPRHRRSGALRRARRRAASMEE